MTEPGWKGPQQPAARLRRVKAAIAAARRVNNPEDILGRAARQRLVAATGLSAAGVSLALSQHLETDPSEADLRALLAAFEPAEACHVVLSANVCTAPLRALACALAVAPRVSLKPSRRDPVMAELLVEALRDDECCEVTLVKRLAAAAGEVVHAYGSDDSMQALRQGMADGVHFVGHGTGFGVAVVAGGELVAAAEQLARDVVPFDGRGCLSPRLVLVAGAGPMSAAARAGAFAQRLHQALTRAGASVPAGPLTPDERAARAHYGQLMAAIGHCYRGRYHMVACDEAPAAIALPPPGRALLVVACRLEQAAVLLAPWRRYVTALGADGDSALRDVVVGCCPGARQSKLGWMQRPPLDGPVDRR